AVLGDLEDVTGTVHRGVYPAVVTEQEFYRARCALEGRRIGQKGVGRAGKGNINLFAGLLIDARVGSRSHRVNHGRGKGPGHYLVSRASLRREAGAAAVAFPHREFEEAILSLLKEVKPAEVLGRGDGPDEVMILSGKLRAVEDAISALNKDM